MKKGFTLIELLVVVLIIGILSAIAIPTYQRVVQRANMARVQTVLDFYMKAVDMYLLENGYPGQYNPVYFDKDGGVSSTYSASYMNGGSFSVSCTYFCRISFSAKEENSSTIAWSIELIKKEETAGWYPQFNHSSNIGRETDNIPIMCEWLKNNTRFNQSMVDARCASFHLGSGY